MAEDIRESNLPEINPVWLRGINAQNNSGKASIDFITNIIFNKGQCLDANKSLDTGFYTVDSNVQNLIYRGFGILVVFEAGYLIQVYFSGDAIQVRKITSKTNPNFDSWYVITLNNV